MENDRTIAEMQFEKKKQCLDMLDNKTWGLFVEKALLRFDD